MTERLQIFYQLESCTTFYKTKEAFGGLSNMAGGYVIQMGDIVVRSSEHLYQAMRFADPELQKLVLAPPSPMTAKMIAKKHKHLTRPDWEEVKISIMEWVVELKLRNNMETFGPLLVSALVKNEIVELSPKDNFWGAIPLKSDPRYARGTNVLGRLLWRLARRHQINLPIRTKPYDEVPNLIFLGQNAVELAA